MWREENLAKGGESDWTAVDAEDTRVTVSHADVEKLVEEKKWKIR